MKMNRLRRFFTGPMGPEGVAGERGAPGACACAAHGYVPGGSVGEVAPPPGAFNATQGELFEVDDPIASRSATPELARDLASVLNRHCADNGSNTPDFILAGLLTDVLEAFDTAVISRGDWYNHLCRVGCNHLGNHLDDPFDVVPAAHGDSFQSLYEKVNQLRPDEFGRVSKGLILNMITISASTGSSGLTWRTSST